MRKIALSLLLLSVFASSAFADERDGWQCWVDASERYNVPIDLLYAVARVETGNRSQIVSKSNKDGSYDIGLMQINSSHLKRLSKYGISEKDLLNNACLNLHVGAWLLSDSIKRHGYNWKGVGAYNAASNDKRKVYTKKVISMYGNILKERGTDSGFSNVGY